MIEIENDNLVLRRTIPYPYNIAELLSRQIEGASFTGESARQLIADTLTDREQQVIEMLWRDGKTYAEAGKVFNVTRERIRQIEAKALRKFTYPTRAKEYAAVPYKLYAGEQAARRRAEERLDWFLQHGKYEVSLSGNAAIQNDVPSPSLPLEEMDMSVRTFNCLTRYGCQTLADVLKIPSEEEFSHIRNLGVKSRMEVLEKVHALGYQMAWEVNGDV